MKGTIAELGIGKVKRPEEHVYTLPKGVEAWEKVRMRMVGWSGMPAWAAPLTEMGDPVIVERLQISELKVNFRVKVSSHIILDRSAEEAVVTSTVYMKLGGSNCDRMRDMLSAMGKQVLEVTKRGWRPTRQAMEDMVKAVKNKVDRSAVVVGGGGTRLKYHNVEGKLVVAAPRQMVGMVRNCREVLEEVADNRKVLVGPGPRYLRARCCDKVGHCSNFDVCGYRKDLLCNLQEAKEALWRCAGTA